MLICFLGYVLPFGQISFWAATVITKFVRVIPILGNKMVIWLWRGFGVNLITVKFFYTLHFLLPIVLLFLVILHLKSLHLFGSTNPIFFKTDILFIKFTPKFVFKDIINFVILFRFFFLLKYNIFFEAVNFLKADFVVSPSHIKPEWYFLFAYGILRRVPDKLTGILLIFFSILCFIKYVFFKNLFLIRNFKNFNKIRFFLFLFNFICLRWIGGNPITDFFILNGVIRIVIFFLYFLL